MVAVSLQHGRMVSGPYRCGIPIPGPQDFCVDFNRFIKRDFHGSRSIRLVYSDTTHRLIIWLGSSSPRSHGPALGPALRSAHGNERPYGMFLRRRLLPPGGWMLGVPDFGFSIADLQLPRGSKLECRA